jgi:hypothetical protein
MSRGDKQNGYEAMPSGGLSGHVDDWENLAIDYLDGQVDAKTRAAVELHLCGCPACAARLQTQRNVSVFLQKTPLEDAPPELEEKVLGELLFSPKPAVRVSTRPALEEPSRWSLLWRRKIRPWVPAAIGVAAVLVAIVSFGLLRSVGGDSAPVTVAASASVHEEAATDGERYAPQTYSNTADASVTTLAAASTTEPMLGTAGAADSTVSTVTAATFKATSLLVQDKKAMVANLEAAEAPAYFVFEKNAESYADSDEVAAPFVDQVTLLTGLAPLDGALWLDGPTFAAYLVQDNAAQLVDLLQAIGTSLGLTVGMSMQPPDAVAELVTPLIDRKMEFPELSAHRTPQPAISAWSFSASPLPQDAGPAGAGETAATPDEVGTHVLIVFYLKN